MFDRFKRSFALVKASAAVLRQDTHLLVFPLISAVSSLLVVLCFALPMFGLHAFDDVGGNRGVLYSGGFLFYVAQYFVIFYFNVALVGATMMRLDGGAPTVKDGLRIANSRLGAILGYAVIAATVGIVLRAIQERLGFVGRIIVGLLGVGWTVATFMVVPVLVVKNTGPIDSIKESASMLRQTWGENAIGQAGIGTVFAVLSYLLVLATAGLALVAVLVLGSPMLAMAFAGFGVLLFLIGFLVSSALSGIYSAALYRYAANGDAALGFDNNALQTAFLQKQ